MCTTLPWQPTDYSVCPIMYPEDVCGDLSPIGKGIRTFTGIIINESCITGIDNTSDAIRNNTSSGTIINESRSLRVKGIRLLPVLGLTTQSHISVHYVLS